MYHYQLAQLRAKLERVLAQIELERHYFKDNDFSQTTERSYIQILYFEADKLVTLILKEEKKARPKWWG